MSDQNTGRFLQRLHRRDPPVRPYLHRQTVVVRHLPHAGLLHVEGDAPDGAEDGVDRQFSDPHPAPLLGRGVSPSLLDGELHLHLRLVGVGGEQVEIGVEDLDLGRSLDVPRRHDALAPGLQVHPHRPLPFHLQPEFLDLQDDVDHVLPHVRDRRELVRDVDDADGSHRRAGERGEQHATQGVPQGNAVTALQRADDVPAVLLRGRINFDLGQYR